MTSHISNNNKILVYAQDRTIGSSVREKLKDYRVLEADSIDQLKICFDIGKTEISGIVVELSDDTAWSALEYIKTLTSVNGKSDTPIFAVISSMYQSAGEIENPFKSDAGASRSSESTMAKNYGVDAVVLKSAGYENLLILIETYLS